VKILRRFGRELLLQYANGQITLNGQKMSLEDFVGMFAMPALNVPAVPAIPQQ
ncbi:hypothetical protein ACUOA5_11895, partial [Escherichia coli]